MCCTNYCPCFIGFHWTLKKKDLFYVLTMYFHWILIILQVVRWKKSSLRHEHIKSIRFWDLLFMEWNSIMVAQNLKKNYICGYVNEPQSYKVYKKQQDIIMIPICTIQLAGQTGKDNQPLWEVSYKETFGVILLWN